MGSCPAYTVTVHGDGKVEYEGWFFVAVSGHHQAQVSPQAVRTLFDAFFKADFFGAYTTRTHRAITPASFGC
jgi:hypothetical protein